MKRVYQTKYGKKEGNCFQACIASLFELSLKDIPDFCNHEPIEKWYEYFLSWLRIRGFSSINIQINKNNDLNRDNYKNCFLIVTGDANKVRHTVIYKNGKLVHDPNKHSKGVIPDTIIIVFPLNPKL